jgi:hypothetical protein
MTQMPMYNFDFNRSVTNLNLNAARSGIFTPAITSLELRAENLQRFNEVVQRVAPGKPAFNADQIAGAARRVLRAAMKGQESTFIKVRMRRAGEIRAALDDVQWDVAAKTEPAMREIIAYLDEGASALIDNDVPVVGLLDDAILVDAAMETLRGELDDYADFCRYRVGEAARLGIPADEVEIRRERWYSDRQQELRLEQQLRRVRGTNYGRSTSTAPGFRIC